MTSAASANASSANVRASRRRMTDVAAGSIVRTTGKVALVPACRGFTASLRPSTIARWKASFVYRGPSAEAKSSSALVSFSVNSATAAVSIARWYSPIGGGPAEIGPGRRNETTVGRSLPPHDQVSRNQSVGSTWIVAASEPRFVTATRATTSSGDALAYSTTTSKYLHSSRTPVSSSSYSGSFLERRPFSSTSSS